VLTIGELETGSRLPSSPRRRKIERWVRGDFAHRFTGRVLAVDAAVAERWGQISGASEARGKSLPVIDDALIAATGLAHGLVVVTRDRCGSRTLRHSLPESVDVRLSRCASPPACQGST
jgi:predicted nucleic acid-binding protein